MAEKEYIERDSIYRRVKERTNPYGKPTLDYASGVKVLELIEREPAADVAEVVRCKDCVNYCGFEHCKNGICDKDVVSKRAVYPTDFCSYGERKEQK